MFADVVVDIPIEQSLGGTQQEGRHSGIFTYRVPPHVEVHIGSYVWVPFGRQFAQGLVVALSDTSHVSTVRDILSVAEPVPYLDGAHITLARWMSEYYLCSLADAIFCQLPQGIAQKAVTTLVPRTGDDSNLTDPQRAVLSFLRQRGPTELRIVRQTLRLSRPEGVVQALIRRGLVDQVTTIRPPAARPKFKRVTFLVVDQDAVAAEIARLREPWFRRARILRILRGSSHPLPLDDLCREAAAAPEVVEALAERHLLHIAENRCTIRLVGRPEAVRDVLARYDLPPTQRAILQTLLDSPYPLDLEVIQRVGASRADVEDLEGLGLVELANGQKMVTLVASREQVEEAIRDLETPPTGGQAGVLAILSGYDAPVELSEVYKATGTTLTTLRALEAKGLVHIEEREVRRQPLAGRTFASVAPVVLTNEQEQAWAQIRAALVAPPGFRRPILLHGVTGSGKTELYMRALEETLRRGGQGIVLVPEISLTPQAIHRFAARFPGNVAILHSGLSIGERFDEWRRIRDNGVDIVIGSRSAVFAPLPRLSLIIIDEEHEWTYKQSDQPPRYHARDVALKLAEITGALVILGSATPDMASWQAAQDGRFHLARLTQRITTVPSHPPGGPTATVIPLPPVQVVDMREELKAGNLSLFSQTLVGALRDVLAAREQAILFLNRRGTASFVQCRDCGYVATCSRCSVAMTYHGDVDALICHQCNHRITVPRRCPACWSTRIRQVGAGTERVVAEVQRLFPQARVLRWDRDVTPRWRFHDAILEEFTSHRADILVGTQMVAKGLDLPLVTLVGVINADIALYLPDFRAAERTFQLLAQVAGRAGRGIHGGQVIIQTYSPDHAAIRFACTHNTAGFAAQELTFRREQGYPPARTIVRLIYAHSNRETAQQEAERQARELHLRCQQLGLAALEVIGPAPCFLSRLRGRYRWHIVLRGSADPKDRAGSLHALLQGMTFPRGWAIDVDPVNVL